MAVQVLVPDCRRRLQRGLDMLLSGPKQFGKRPGCVCHVFLLGVGISPWICVNLVPPVVAVTSLLRLVHPRSDTAQMLLAPSAMPSPSVSVKRTFHRPSPSVST